MTAHEARHQRRDALLNRISAKCSERLCYMTVVERETRQRDGVNAWRELCRAHQAERAYLVQREERATRLSVRLMYTPQGRRERDSEYAADCSWERTFGEPPDRDADGWEWEDGR